MQYIILAFFIFLAFLFFYKIVLPINEPDFKLKGQLSENKLKDAVRDLALHSRTIKDHGKGLSLYLIKKNIKKAYNNISRKIQSGEECFEFENWIYDNYYKLSQSINDIKPQLNKFYFLPHSNDLPRVYEYIQLLVKSCDGYITDRLLFQMTEYYNTETPLKYNEIMAIKPCLYYAALEYVSIFCSKSIQIEKLTKKAKADAKEDKVDLAKLKYNSYICAFYNECKPAVKQNIFSLCLDNGQDINTRIDNFFLMTARYNGQMQSAISTIQSIEKFCTDEYILSLSPVYEMLEFERNICFKEVTVDTKYLYLINIFKIAKKKKISELAVLRECLEQANYNKKDLSFYILPPPKSSKKSYIYIGAYVALTLTFSSIFSLFFKEFFVLIMLISLPVFFAFSGIIVGSVSKVLFSRRQLPSYDLKFSDDKNIHSLIAVSRLVANKAEVDNAFKHLETILYANKSTIFKYCLLIDLLTSAENIYSEEDEKIIERCRELYEDSEHKDRYLILLRERRSIKNDTKFQGWEKKRGAILELNRYLLNGDSNGFRLILGNSENTKYVVALDSDTLTNSAYRLVSLMEHPYNRDTNIISVKMSTDAKDANETHFSKIFSGGIGLDNYSNYAIDAENDLFASGNYTGKGIYRVREFQEKLCDAFEENRILSHDYIEGAYVSCANSNETALDSFPVSFSKFLSRQIRWLRGDWQLLPFLKPKVKKANGEKIKNPISPVNKWHIFSNLVNSLVPVSSMLLLLLSLFMQKPAYMALISFLTPIVYFLLSIRASVMTAQNLWIYELIRQSFFVFTLPITAYQHFKAICITIYRLITKKKLLEWKVFAHSTSKVSFIPNYLVAILFLSTAIIYNKAVFFYILSGAFAVGVFLDMLLNRAITPKKYESAHFDNRLKEIFYSTYAYFTAQEKEEFNYLPCDNYQEYSDIGYVMRTSPTNIGFSLVARVCAYEMEIITLDELNEICKKIIGSVEKLPKWKGNLYNWIDIQSLTTLKPSYVSSVDSGNFLACLALLLPYCDESLKKRVKKIIEDTKIEALFDVKRGLFSIGYNADTGMFDDNHYDLIGSESSILYLISIGFGKIGKNAWNNLSRQSVKFGRKNMFYSWTGGMFEHLMTPLFFEYQSGTVFSRSKNAVVAAQKKYAKIMNHKIFGISESQYFHTDGNNLYQYKAFGIPQIALSNVNNPQVASPYAGILAINTDPKASEKNIEDMIQLGLMGKFGMYEAIDLEKNKVINTYMSHHQGMILAAICNRLKDNALIKSMESQGNIRAANILLTESSHLKGHKKLKSQPKRVNSVTQTLYSDARHKIPYTNFLSNGKYSVVIDENGSGYSSCENIMLTRFSKRGDGQNISANIDGKKYSLLSGVCSLNADSSVFEKNSEKFRSKTEVYVLPNMPGEVRIVEFNNISDKKIKVKFDTYCEAVVNDRLADISHQAYANMFTQTKFDDISNYIYAFKTNKKNPVYFAHYILTDENVSYTTSRHNYFARGKKRSDFGTTLDPILSGSFIKEIKPKSTVYFTVFYYAAKTTGALENYIRLSRVAGFTERIRGSSFALSKYADLSLATKKTAAQILYCNDGKIKEDISPLNSNRPVVALEVKNESGLERLKNKLIQLKKLYKYLIDFHLIIAYSERHNYYLHITEQINKILDDLSYRRELSAHSTIRLVNAQAEPKAYKNALNYAVNTEITDFEIIDENNKVKPAVVHKSPPLPPFEYVKKQGIGGYLDDYSYAMDLSDIDTPAAWSNIIAGASFGTIITESGGGYTFEGNSRQNKLTHFSNDAVLDIPSEFVILGEKNNFWSITKKPVKTQSNYQVIHTFGATEFSNNYNGFISKQTVYISKEDSTKFYDITLENKAAVKRSIDLMFCIDPILGDFKINTHSSISVTKSGNIIELFCAHTGTSAYVGCSKKINSFSKYKEAFTDCEGNITKNSELKNEGSELFLSCSINIEIPPDSTQRIIFSLGTDRNINFELCDEILQKSKSYFSSLSKISVDGYSDEAIISRWLPYQILTSRFFARTGFYQSGGAIGFRDQLQDSLALLHIEPGLTKKHILLSAMHQFEAGDVQHWWHPPAVGVRTTISDDKLFLPLAVSEYVNYTHDYEIMSERVPYLQNIKMQAGESSVYSAASYTNRSESILEHCLKAIYSAFDFNDSGLVKMRGGDWNDAMDEVGRRGEGTSVWLTMFLHYVIEKFLPLVTNFNDRNKLVDTLQSLKKALEKTFDGEWFTRAVTDEGLVLGSADSLECQIDLISQSFSVLSHACDKKNTEIALYSAEKKLVDYDNKIIKLLTPPFSKMENIGYISSYPKGIRENGGQYTHAAVWFIMALIESGKTEKAWELFNMINPINHTKTIEQTEKYAIEPYVLAGDVYGGEFSGMGGWSWYTGSAAWYYRCLTEEFYGLKFRGKKLFVEPHLPSSVKTVSLKVRTEYGDVFIEIDNSAKTGQWRAIINNINYNSNEISLSKSIAGKKIIIKRI